MSCHGRDVKADGRTIPGFEKLLADNLVHHGPIDDGECAVCHQEVHGGNNYQLLAEPYPAKLYEPYTEKEYALCFGCHEAEAFASAETDDATGFRNGRQNLHFVHVSRQKKGRTCKACHDMHASKLPHLIAESVPFGSWRIPLGYQATTDGGSCAPGCHRPYRYDREKPVSNLADVAAVPSVAPSVAPTGS